MTTRPAMTGSPLGLSAGALTICALGVKVHAAHAGLGGEGNEGGESDRRLRARAGHIFPWPKRRWSGLPGVSSAREASWAASASSSILTPGAGMNSVAWRLPRVMVPVLSSSSTSTSPAASTARPLVARTLRRIRRSMPAMPMALNKPPMVVGIRQTISDSSTGMEVSTTPFWPAWASL